MNGHKTQTVRLYESTIQALRQMLTAGIGERKPATIAQAVEWLVQDALASGNTVQGHVNAPGGRLETMIALPTGAVP